MALGMVLSVGVTLHLAPLQAVMETRKAEHLRECAEWEAQIAQEEAMHKVSRSFYDSVTG